MEVQRTLNGKPITREELSRLEITNPTLESIMASVQRRYSRKEGTPENPAVSSGYAPKSMV